MSPPPSRPVLLVAAFSARQIARSAERAGFDVLAVDFFNDSDLAGHCIGARRLGGHYPDGFSAEALLDALESLATGRAPVGFVYGAGFEDRPALLDAIGRRWPLLGVDGATVRRLKDPLRFAQDCAAAGIDHPETRAGGAVPADGWLAKQAGGAGGSHVRDAAGHHLPDGYYLQRKVEGDRLSLGFIAAGRHIESLGVTRQWTRPTADAPYRYGGAVGPLPPDALELRLAETVARFCARVPLVGLASADFVVGPGRIVLLEINPRPGATLDVHDTADDPLLARHLAAAGLDLPVPPGPPARPRIRASGLAWAHAPIAVPPSFRWPSHAADLPAAGTCIAAGEPICTIIVAESGNAATEGGARAVFDRREAAIIDALERNAA